VIVVKNFIDTTVAERPSVWTNADFAPATAAAMTTGLAAARAYTPASASASAKNRNLNYISSSVAAAGSLRADHDAKQAAPPRGNPR
jgi:hypothetical protein